MLHKNIPAEDNHAAYTWAVADEAARLALSVVSADIGKICWQQDADLFFFLKATTPTWVSLGSSLLALDDLTDVSAMTPAVGASILWNGSEWIAQLPSTGGVGAAKTLFLNQTLAVADNYSLTTQPTGTAESSSAVVCNSATNGGITFIERYTSSALGGTSIEGGKWKFNTYAAVSSATGISEIIARVNKRVLQSGITVTFTGSGATRTLTATGGTPFISGHATASPLTAALIETSTQTAWISGFTSSSVVTVTLTDPGFVNVSDVALTAIYTLLFSVSTGEINATAVALYSTESIQPSYAINAADTLVVAYFGKTDSGSNRTLTLYRDGAVNYTNLETPLLTRHNDQAGLNEGDYVHLTAAEYAALGAAGTLDSLTDVVLTSPTNGQVLKFNGTNWVNGTDENSGGGGGSSGFEQHFLLMGA